MFNFVVYLPHKNTLTANISQITVVSVTMELAMVIFFRDLLLHWYLNIGQFHASMACTLVTLVSQNPYDQQ